MLTYNCSSKLKHSNNISPFILIYLWPNNYYSKVTIYYYKQILSIRSQFLSYLFF
ncbi:hypothetical protein SA930_1117 [Staphylococcus aureus 930918-3]|nr:hypothetical protein SA930_1117 [Staphylococcus aureus 930918-3]EEW47105.1 hypothetical protein SAD30_2078 [Staphylococcus aureus D30]EFB96034.1 conserved hypothetical protein [Staphylococcus aureus A10102]EFB97667.1 conserved hypothetical protein [Staphylococcus aureus A9765]EFC03689.1 hypothetical protein SGAG_01425 [Staphylococcus aureus A8117]EFH25959.1 hypothetical protein HMPREF0782_0929 [Staphylococcus aureus subsp. aureus ATCC 51811]EFK81841.1 hypothetical protein HMPREF0773_12045 